MAFNLIIQTDNDSFTKGRKVIEVARILRETARRIEQGEDFTHYRTLFDSYGFGVGRAALTEGED